jgi:hypothetical protein
VGRHQFPADNPRESFGDRARFGFILEDLEGCPKDGMLDLFGVKFDDGPIPFLDFLGHRPLLHVWLHPWKNSARWFVFSGQEGGKTCQSLISRQPLLRLLLDTQ